MKIAVLSDIHGNKLALDRVLGDIEKENADKIFVLGDLAMGGYDPNYTIEKLFYLKELIGDNCKIIQGNTDKLIVDYSDELFENMHKVNPLMAEALQADIKEITPENKEKLKNLPINLSDEEYNVSMLLVHGSPRKQDENIYPDTTLPMLDEILANVKENIVFCGHTHIPCGLSLNSGKTIVNVGSVGRSMIEDKMPVYLLMTINQSGSFSFEFRVVKYDNKAVSEIIEKRDFKSAKEFSKLYL